MANKEVVLTYKRKRFSSQSYLNCGANAPDLSLNSHVGITSRTFNPKAEFGTFDKELNKDHSHRLGCDAFNVNENTLSCECCLRTSHGQCTDSAQKYIKENWRCLKCHRMNNYEDSVEDHAQASKRVRKRRRNEESEMGPMKLRSQKVLLMKLAEDHSNKGTSYAADSSVSKSEVPIQMDNLHPKSASRSNFTDVDDIRKSIPGCVNSSSEIKCSSQCPEESFMMVPKSVKANNKLSNDVHPKERCRTPLITFCRRVKKKCGGSEKSIEMNLKSEENQCASATESRAIEPSTTFAVAVLLEQTKMDNIEKDNGFEPTPAGGSAETKIVGEKCEELPSNSAHEPDKRNPLPSQMASNISSLLLSQPASVVPDSEDPSDGFMAAPATSSSVVSQASQQENSVNIGTNVGREFRNDIALMESEKTILPYNVPEKRHHTRELELSAGPPASPYAFNIKSSKPAMDVVTENLLKSQNSSAPGCAVVTLSDDETDGRGKELRWLEDLEKVLQDKKKERGKSKLIGSEPCTFTEKSGINRGQASNGRGFPLIATKSFLRTSCDQDAYTEDMYPVIPLQEKVLMPNLADPGPKQQNEENLDRIHCADFLGPSPSLNFGAPADSFKDFHFMLSPPSLGAKDNITPLNRHLPWHALEGTSCLQRHKLNNENVTNRSRVIKESKVPFFDKFQKYPNEWSQEELDFLWIGVRRHGIGNWNAMLRDRRLRFLESRAAEDLAMRWDVEQRMLLNGTIGTTVQPLSFSRLYHSSHIMDDGLLARQTAANHYSIGGVWPHAGSEFPMLTTETKPSPGDSCPWSKNLFHSSGVGTINILSGTSSSINTFLGSLSDSKAGIKHQKPIIAQSIRYDWDPSTSQQKSSEIPTHEDESAGPSRTIPHWMKDVFNNKASRPVDSPPLPVVSATTLSANLLNSDLRLNTPFSYKCEPCAPVKDSFRRGLLKRKSIGSGSSSGLRTSPNEARCAGILLDLGTTCQKSALDTAVSECKNIPNLNEKCSGLVGPSELVVIESDASSEETISDTEA